MKFHNLLVLTVLLFPLVCLGDSDEVVQDPLQAMVQTLVDASLKEKRRIVEDIARFDDPRVLPVLSHLLKGDLHYRKSDKAILVVGKTADKAQVVDWISGSTVSVEKKARRKIRTNNQLRGKLRNIIAELELTNVDRDIRRQAVMRLLNKSGGGVPDTIRSLIDSEKDREVRALMQVILDFETLEQSPPYADDLFRRLSRRLEPEVRNRLVSLTRMEDRVVAGKAADALREIDSRVRFYGHLETLFFGISLGSVLVLAAIGLAITFGVMGVINMAHGELIMIGAYTTWVMQQLIPGLPGTALVLSIPAAFMVAGLVGVLIERLVIRHLYGRPLETLLATFGISLILQQAVRSIFSPLNRSVISPSWMSGTTEINSVLSLTNGRLVIIAFCLGVFVLLSLLMQRTRLGLEVRAVSQNRPMARAMGIRSARVDTLTFGLGAGVAGIAGVALSQLTNVGPNLGQGYIIDSFLVVVFGGVGNLWGTLVSGFSLGIANKFLEPWSGTVLAKILILVFIILFIQRRPRGLFPQKGRAVES